MGVTRAALLLALIPAGAVRLHVPRALFAPLQPTVLRSSRPVTMADAATDGKVKIKIKVKSALHLDARPTAALAPERDHSHVPLS